MQTVAPRLEVRGLSKTFAGVKVLDAANLTVEAGEIHALVGQNGSGKSTLIKLISGVYRADPGGDIYLDGERIGTPVDAGRLHDAGLAFVHQDLGLVKDLSVRENVRVGRHATRGFFKWIDTARDARAVSDTFEFLGVDIRPETKVSSLTPSERVAVAVARALQDRKQGSGVIVFDESTRSIPHEALPAFYEMIRMLASQGTAVLIVSHNLKEVLQIADRTTALRNGRVIEMGVPTSELDEAALTRMVLGRDGEPGNYAESMPSQQREDGGVTLRDLAGGRLQRVDAQVRRGEVVGFTGTVNSGLSDLAPLIAGAAPGSGAVEVDGTVLSPARASSAASMKAGIAYIPQDRHGQGLAMGLTVNENVTLPHLRKRGRPWWTGRAWQDSATGGVISRFEVVPADRNAAVATLSGGNQQKVLMGKWLVGGPKLLVLDDPTQAVDVGARSTVLRATRQAAVDGAAVVLCSSEVEDLAAVCDRVLVLEDGNVVRELQQPLTADAILSAIFSTDESTKK